MIWYNIHIVIPEFCMLPASAIIATCIQTGNNNEFMTASVLPGKHRLPGINRIHVQLMQRDLPVVHQIIVAGAVINQPQQREIRHGRWKPSRLK